jgi:SAM-dependent methyltransferase
MPLSDLLRALEAPMPPGLSRLRRESRRLHYVLERRRGVFAIDAAEFERLGEWVGPGDWVLDLGAGAGQFAYALAERVGSTGKVLAFEADLALFALLVDAAADAPDANILPFPCLPAAEPTDRRTPPSVTLPIQALAIPFPVRFVRIDTGLEELVVTALRPLLLRDHPTILLRDTSAQARHLLRSLGYTDRVLLATRCRLFDWQSGRDT